MGGDFNAHIATLPNTIDTNAFVNCHKRLSSMRLSKQTLWLNNIIKMPSGWGHELLDLCCDVGLFILNGWTHGDESGDFTCLANGGHNTIDYILGSPIIWQAATHFEVIIDDTHYCAMRGDSDHMPLRLHLNIYYNFVEPQHIVVTIFFWPTFKYDKSKAKEYQLALTTSLGNLWVVDSIGHLGVDGLTDLL
jgi:hypothetical protein